MNLTQKAKAFLLKYNEVTKKKDFFSLDFRKLHRNLQEFPDFSNELLTSLAKQSPNFTSQFLKIWLFPISSLIKELLSTSQISEFDSFFKNSLLYLEIEQKALGFMQLFHSDKELSSYYLNSLTRMTTFFKNLSTLKTLLFAQKEEISDYRFCIYEIFVFSLDLIQIFQPCLHLIPAKESYSYKILTTFLKKNISEEGLNVPIRSNNMQLGEIGESIEEIDSRFKESYVSSNLISGMNLPLSLNTIEKKNEMFEINLDLNTSVKIPRKNEIETTNGLTTDNISRRQRILSRISQKIREKSIYRSHSHKKISTEEFKLENQEEKRIVWLTNAEMRETEKNQMIKMNAPGFINKYNSKTIQINENDEEKLRNFNEAIVLSSVNYDDVKYEQKIDLKKEKFYEKYSKNEKNNATLIKFQEKLFKLQDEKEMEKTVSTVGQESSDSTTHKENAIGSTALTRGSLLMGNGKRNSKKIPSKIIKDSYEQMKEIEKKNQTILKTFKKSKEKSKIRHKKKKSMISIININGVCFQEAEDIIGKNQTASLTPEFVKDVDEEDVLSNSSSTSEEEDDEKEWNSVRERKIFLNSLFVGCEKRLNHKRHSVILTGKEGRLDSQKLIKLTEKKNLFQNWHLVDNIELLRNVSAFNVKTSIESVNFFIIKFLLNMKLKTHKYTSHLKVIKERWNKIKFAFQMFLLYRKMHEKKKRSFFDEAHIIVMEMKEMSLLHKFDKFLYLMERNKRDLKENKLNEMPIESSDFFKTRTNSQRKNINQILISEEAEEKFLILERGMKKFAPRKIWNNGKKFMAFDGENIQNIERENIKPL